MQQPPPPPGAGVGVPFGRVLLATNLYGIGTVWLSSSVFVSSSRCATICDVSNGRSQYCGIDGGNLFGDALADLLALGNEPLRLRIKLHVR